MSYLDSGDPELSDDRRFDLEVALEWGRYPDGRQVEEIRQLLIERRFRDAFELIEVASRLPPRDDMYYLSMGDVAKLLGLEERAAHYHRLHEAGFDYFNLVFERSEAMVRSGCTVTEGILAVIDICAEARPHDDWQLFRTLDYDGDARQLRDWLEALLALDPAPQAVDGFWFGLVNPVRGGEVTSDIYLGGGEGAAQHPDAWAERLTWTPRDHAQSEVLASIHSIAHANGTDGLGLHAEHPLCLTYACLAVRWLLTTLPPRKILGDAPLREIQVGYDAGDFFRLGTLTGDGLSFPTNSMI